MGASLPSSAFWPLERERSADRERHVHSFLENIDFSPLAGGMREHSCERPPSHAEEVRGTRGCGVSMEGVGIGMSIRRYYQGKLLP